ncbi:MAG: glycoside hydrolase family 24 [Nevskia sp.]|nr:glycoside hydrolase family 24 [Nevskia sp.]
MKTSSNGIAVIQYFEQCKLEAYPDPGTGGAPWTIGWGDTGPDVIPGMCINQAEADGRLAKRLVQEFEPAINEMVQQQPTQGQFDALVCLGYNIGLPNLRGSTLMRLFNLADLEGAAEQFLVWNRSGGKVMLGLRRRRAAEKALFLGASGLRAIAAGQAVS